MKVSIDGWVPPPKQGSDSRLLGLPEFMSLLEIGDSFVMPYKKVGSAISASHLIGIRVVTEQHGFNDVRVWRVRKNRKPEDRHASDFLIERGVPVPSRNHNLVGMTDAIRQMEVGDSFVIDLSRRGSVQTTGRRIGYRLRTESIGGDQIRVWRMKKNAK